MYAPRLRIVATFLCGIALGTGLSLVVQVRADDPPPPGQPADAAARRCESLSGLERSECERKIAVQQEKQEATSAPKSREAAEKEEKARAEEEAARASSAADPASDAADAERKSGSKVRQATAPPPNPGVKSNDENPPREPASEATEDSDTDTLDRPRH